MNTDDLDAIRARAEAATAAPWSVNYEEEDNYSVTPNGRWESGVAFAAKAPDAEFIAHAREDVPALLAEVKRLGNVLATSENARAGALHHCDETRAEAERLREDAASNRTFGATVQRAEVERLRDVVQDGAERSFHLGAAVGAVRAVLDGVELEPGTHRLTVVRRVRAALDEHLGGDQ